MRSALVCAALVVCAAHSAAAQGLKLPESKPHSSPFSMEKGKTGFDSTQTQAPNGKAPATAPAKGSAQKPALVKAEEALEQNRPKDAVNFAVEAVKEEPESGHAWFVLARAQQAANNIPAAIAAGEKASTFPSVRASALYNLACVYAVSGDKDKAFTTLNSAKFAGFADRDQMMKDPDLATLRTDKRFALPGECNYFTMKLKDGKDLPFCVWLPHDYDPAKAYPVLVAPGQGKKIKDNWGGLFWGEDTSQRGWIAVESPALMMEDPIGATGQLFDEIAKRYKVENGQFHLLGYGPSSAPAFGVAAVMPQRIKSLWVMPGFPVGIKDEGLARLKPMKVCFVVGDADPYWYQESMVAYNKLKALNVDAYLEVVKGGDHLLQGMFGGELAERLSNVR
jgi:tetratricopeptide (TPR) repeat protein